MHWGALGLSPRSEEILREMMRKLERDEPVDPVYYFAHILELDPRKFREAIQAVSQLAGSSLQYVASQPRLKSDLWMEFIRRNRRNPAGYAGLGRSRADQGDYRSSVVAYTRAIALGGGTPENYYNRGFSAEQLGDHELANRDAQKVLAADPANPAALSLFKLTQGLPSKLRIDAQTGETQPGEETPFPQEEQEALGRTEVSLA